MSGEPTLSQVWGCLRGDPMFWFAAWAAVSGFLGGMVFAPRDEPFMAGFVCAAGCIGVGFTWHRAGVRVREAFRRARDFARQSPQRG